MKESDIRFEGAGFAVYREPHGIYNVVVCSTVGSALGFEQYDDESLAIARAQYLAKNSNAERLHTRLTGSVRANRK